MAARWLGLLGSHQRTDDLWVPYRQRRFWQRPSVVALRTVGWAGAIACALAVNAIAFRDVVAPPARASMTETAAGKPQLVSPKAGDVHLLAATMWGEARSEGEDGMRAVAHVMVNRVGPRFGETLQTVILAPKQFSAWNLNDPNRPLVQNPERYAKGGDDRITWEAAQRIAYEVLSGASVDPTHGALFYHTRAINPSWARYGAGKEVIGAHVFYQDVPDQRARVTRIDPVGALAAMLRPTPAARAVQIAHRGGGPRAGRVRGVIQHAPARSETPAPEADVLQMPDPVTHPPIETPVNLTAETAGSTAL